MAPGNIEFKRFDYLGSIKILPFLNANWIEITVLIKIHITFRRCFLDLMSNEKPMIRESPHRLEAFNTYLKVLEECFPPNVRPKNKQVSPGI